MKVSPVATATPTVNVNTDEGHSAGVDRLARAKAVAAGQDPAPATQAPDLSPAKEQTNVNRIKMKTQRSTNRPVAPPVQEPAGIDPSAAAAPTQSDTLDPVGQAQGAEATPQLSPQEIAVAKAKRALQVEKAQFEAQKAEFEKARSTPTQGWTKDQIQANALGILREAGVTNEQLTEAVLREASDFGPGYTKLEAEIAQLKAALETQNKSLSERDKAQETQVLTQIRRTVDSLIATGDEFETIREAGYAPKVVELIHKTFLKTGEILDEAEAAQMVEDQLIEDNVKLFQKLNKVQSRITPAQVQQQQAPKSGAPNTKIMKTLTNRDGSSGAPLSRYERAIAAAEGRLKR